MRASWTLLWLVLALLNVVRVRAAEMQGGAAMQGGAEMQNGRLIPILSPAFQQPYQGFTYVTVFSTNTQTVVSMSLVRTTQTTTAQSTLSLTTSYTLRFNVTSGGVRDATGAPSHWAFLLAVVSALLLAPAAIL